VTVDVAAPYLVNMDRKGLRLTGGTSGGTAKATIAATLNAPGTATIDPASTWEISRLAVPLPSIMPSYNQIGFDSLHYLVGLAEPGATGGIAWMVGGRLDDQGNASVDPASKAVFPLTYTTHGGTITMTAQDGLTVNVMAINLPFKSFRVDARLDDQGHDATGPASLVGSSKCASVPLYGTFLQVLGMCNAQTDGISFAAAANLNFHGAQTAPAGVGTVTFTAASDGITATLSGGSLKAADHLASILVVDPTTNQPVTLGYALDTMRTASADGTLATVKLPYNGHAHPANARVSLMIDTFAAAKSTLSL
jgi:hypothetical protein